MIRSFPALAIVVALFAPANLRAADAPPNIVMIISDDQAWGDYSFMQHPQIKTPHLDRLARESLTFPRGYVPSSLCCPSLASIITGKYPHQHKVANNDPPGTEAIPGPQRLTSDVFKDGREQMNKLMDAQQTLPRILTQNGYLALQTGKWWQGHYSRGGFTHGMTLGARHGDAGLDIGRKTMQPIYDFIGEAQKQSKPFFVWYAPMLPHDPHTPPERLLAKYRDLTPSLHVAKYWAMVEWFDETCGELLDHLEKQGLAQNTIVTYVTDNGWIQDPEKPRYAPRSKQSPYDGGLRTPIMIRWPAHIAPRQAETVISSLDLLPTLLAACKIAPPTRLSGVNLLDENAVNSRAAVFGECFAHTAVDLADPATSLRWRWMISEDWKLIVPTAKADPGATVELYNLKADPTEANNLAASEPTRVEKFRAMLDGWWKP